MLGTFRLLTLESLGSENIIALLLENNQNMLMYILAGSQVSDRCPLGYLLTRLSGAENSVDCSKSNFIWAVENISYEGYSIASQTNCCTCLKSL